MLQNKIAIITGASRGIGLAIASLFIKNHATVIGTYKESFSQVQEGIDYHYLDVTDANECESFTKSIIDKYKNIDILVNNAGITDDSLTKNMTNEQFLKVIDVNLKGAWNLTRFIGPFMQKQQKGSIINIASIVGETGNVGQSNYAASKAGLIAMGKTWAKEFSYRNGKVRVNSIAPGFTKTNMTKSLSIDLLRKYESQILLGRLAEPEEIANVALFLASDLSSYITGTVIDVNGGMLL